MQDVETKPDAPSSIRHPLLDFIQAGRSERPARPPEAVMSYLGQDTRLALRRLRQQPGFTSVAVLTLALGLGANTAVFTLVHALILRSLPVERPSELYRLGNTPDCCVNSGLATSYSLFSFRLFEHLKANAPELTELAAFQANTAPFAVRRTGEAVAQSLPGSFVTGNYFTMFGVRPAAGRVLRVEDDLPGAPPVAVMSHRAWTRQFGQDPSVVGEAFVVNGRPLTVVGVTSPQFFGDTIRPDPAALWIPIGQEPAMRGAASLLDRADQNWLYAIGRVAPSASAARIGAHVTAALQQWLSAQSFVGEGERPLIPRQHVVVVPAAGGVGLAQAQYGRSLTVLFAASALVLLIAIANLANLLLARADRGQAAIRAALGAAGSRLIRQALTEGILLALAGGLAGVGVAAIGTQALIKVVFPLVAFVPVDGTPSVAVWLFALTLSVVTGALFAAAPAWALSRTPPLEALSGFGRTLQARSFVPRGSLLIVQVALSLVLLSTAGLLATSLGNLERQRLGFTPDHRLVVRIDPPATAAGNVERLSALFARLDESLRSVPGVERVAWSMYSPMEGNNWSSSISIAGRRSDPARPDSSSWNRVSAGYFETVGTRVLRGRAIDDRASPGGRRVVVVNESFVRRFFEHADPLGQTVGIGDASHGGDFQVVGVVEDVKYTGATQDLVRPMLFLPSFQTVEYSDPTARGVQARSTLPKAIVLQAAPAAQGIEPGVRRAIARVDPNLNVIRVLPMTLQVSANFRLERLMAQLTSIYGLLALALASLGLYGVTAHSVSQRTREIGVRMALGANRARVIRTCVTGPLGHTCAGLAIGVVAALLVGRAISAQLYGVGGIDPTVLVAAVVALALSAISAAALPARRAASANPAVALRGE
jgi:predicted permease